MAILLALCSALAYGLSDFVGGLVSRRTSAWAVAVVGTLSATACTSVLAALTPGSPRLADLGWSVVAGIGSGFGIGFLYRGFSVGRMSVVAPVSAVGSALVPVAVGGVAGERPSGVVWAGIVLALPAIAMVSSTPEQMDDPPGHADPAGGGDSSLLDGTLAGLGFGTLFAALGQIPDTSGFWPLAGSQAVSVVTVALVATTLRAQWLPRRATPWIALAAGPLGAAATGTFLLATQYGFLTVSGVIASLYPASTVLLAALVLRERIHRVQGLGLTLATAAVVLVGVG